MVISRTFSVPHQLKLNISSTRDTQWTGAYVMEFRDLITSSLTESKSHSKEARFSFLQGGYVEDFDNQGSDLICFTCEYERDLKAAHKMATHLLSKWGRTHCETTLIHDSFFLFRNKLYFSLNFVQCYLTLTKFFPLKLLHEQKMMTKMRKELLL